MEVAHTHPVMVTFCHMLWQMIKERKKLELEKSAADLRDTNIDSANGEKRKLIKTSI